MYTRKEAILSHLNNGSAQPNHPHSLIRTSITRLQDQYVQKNTDANRQGTDHTARMRKLICTPCVRLCHKVFFQVAYILYSPWNKQNFFHLSSPVRVLIKCFKCCQFLYSNTNFSNIPCSILHKSIASRYRPVSYPDGQITARYRFL